MTARVLLIEDNPANLELMRYLLEAFDHRTLLARDGVEGVSCAARELPDLILCDLQLPDIDGYEVLRRIRSNKESARIPIVAVTALAMVGDRDRALDAGFDGYVSKPIDPETFVPQVEAFLPQDLRSAGPRAAQAMAPPPTAASHRAAARTILAVDNLQSNLDLVTGIFATLGYRVITTVDAREAVRLAKREAPDLVLSDVCMPDGSGYELIETFKADPDLKRTPFVFITSTMANEEDRRKGLALGAAKFLFRPIEPEELLKEIEHCLEEHR